MKTNVPLPRGSVVTFYSAFIFLLLFVSVVCAQTLPSNFSRVQVVSGLSNPTAMAFTPDGRVLICQQQGALRVVKNGSLLSTPAISLSVNSDGERGLIGVAIDPNFVSNHFVYLYYSTSGTVRNRVSRFTMNGDVLSSEQVIYDFPNDGHMYHNGGGITFGNDGKLYVLSGDDRTPANAQNLDSPFGKVLRINSDGTVPSGNPFTGNAVRSRIWAYGVRNPFTLASDPVSGKIFINDVGESTWEEVNNATTGGINFGWPNSEGACAGACNPVYRYNTNRTANPPDGQGCAISGGTFFNGSISNYPATYNGKYFFLDYCGGWINYIDPNSPTRQGFATGLGDMVYLVQGPDGNLYFLKRGNGTLNRIVYTGTSCAITQQPQNRTVNVGQSATFTVTATGTSLTYQWRKNSVAISGATSSSYTISNAQTSDAGTYSVVISGTSCSLTSSNATLTVNDNNQAPTATIILPANNSFFTPGQTVNFSGSATDPEDGTLPASAYNWEIVFHHASHVHPGPNVTDGVTSGSFVTDDEGHTDADIWYRIHLTVTDSDGKQASTFVDVYPALPAPWVTSDIGTVGVVGAAGFSGNAFALKGSGADIWGTTDEFRYVYQQVSGDVEITGLVERMENPNAWSKTGFMIRQSLNANSAHAMIVVTPSNGVAYQRRISTGGSSTNTSVTGITTPVWLRLKRTGNTITVSRSADGTNWQQVATETVNLGTTVYVGMALTSHADGVLGASVISNVTVVTGSNQAPNVSITAPANNSTFTAPANITITANASDADGTISKVDFYNGSTLLGTDNTSPYSFVWNNVAAGTYIITARATDDDDAVTTSSAVNIIVNAVPVCEPVVASGDDGNVAANTIDNNLNTRWSASGDGQWIRYCLENEQTVSGVKIAFFKGNERQAIFDIQTGSNGIDWTTVSAGVRSSGTSLQLETFNFAAVTAKYVRILGHGNSVNAWNSYTEVQIITGTSVNQPPSVTISSPANNASFTPPATIIINANASDADGSVTKVDFYNGTTLLGTDNTSPYSFAWNNVPVGNYAITATATDNLGAVTTSAVVNVKVNTVNQLPTANITSPANNATYTAPASITINATAADSDGSVTKVDFFSGSTLLGTDNTSPYSFTWNNVSAGNYTLTARATDNQGAVGTSAAVTVKVNNPTNACTGVAQYVENSGYVAGSMVQNVGKKYECRPYPYSGWCNGAAWAYAPGTGTYWTDAWIDRGSCTARIMADKYSVNTDALEAYPNPSDQMVTIELNASVSEAEYVVVNAMGTEIQKGFMNTYSETVIDLSSQPSGIYLIRVKAGEESWEEKVIRK